MKYIRLLHWVKSNKITIFISGITVCAIFFAILRYTKLYNATSTSKNVKQTKILIIYSSGNPDAIVPDMSEEIDAITLPTPKSGNTAIIAEMIANSLKKEVGQVTLKRIEEIKKPEEVLSADVILIGSATRFGIMSWQTKRFFDEILFSIYTDRKAKLSDKYIGCFTTCEVTPSGKDCIKSIYRALYDFKTNKLPGLIILTKTPQDKMEQEVTQFTKNVIAKLKN